MEGGVCVGVCVCVCVFEPKRAEELKMQGQKIT